MKAKNPEMDLIIKKIPFHFNKLLINLYEKIVFRAFDKKVNV